MRMPAGFAHLRVVRYRAVRAYAQAVCGMEFA